MAKGKAPQSKLETIRADIRAHLTADETAAVGRLSAMAALGAGERAAISAKAAGVSR